MNNTFSLAGIHFLKLENTFGFSLWAATVGSVKVAFYGGCLKKVPGVFRRRICIFLWKFNEFGICICKRKLKGCQKNKAEKEKYSAFHLITSTLCSARKASLFNYYFTSFRKKKTPNPSYYLIEIAQKNQVPQGGIQDWKIANENIWL